jgi:large subunit ribosomal protein L9
MATTKKRGTKLPKNESGGIELLLIQTVDNLGKQGDVVSVRRGYAMNYLLPQGLATYATDHHKRMVDKHKVRLQEIEKARLAGLRSLSARISNESVTIEANANDEGHLYGSVGSSEIAQALQAKDFSVSTDMVRLTGPLKELGLYTVKLNLGSGIESELKVWVVPVADDDATPES